MAKYKIPSFDEIVSIGSLLDSWHDFSRGKMDKPDVSTFALQLIQNLLHLESELKSGSYKHGSYYHFKINDPKPRDIHKASVKDRIVHHTFYRALYPFFAKKFIFDSYSCQLGKGTHRALNRLVGLSRKGGKNWTKQLWVLKGDVLKCFASIDHDILKNILVKNIKDKKILNLLEKVIDSFPEKGKRVGIPLGNLTSQLFVNIYLNEFDQFIKHKLKEKYFIRYADDFLILNHSRQKLLELTQVIDNFLSNNLKLSLHPKKIYIKTFYSGVDFLGWVHFPRYCTLRTITKNRMLNKIKSNPTQDKLNSYLGLLSHGNAFNLSQLINHLIRE